MGREARTETRRARGVALPFALVALHLCIQLPLLTRLTTVVMDEPWYAGTAHAVAQGRGFHNLSAGEGGGEVFFLYPALLGLQFRVAWVSLGVGRLLSVLAGAVAVAGVARLLQGLSVRPQVAALCGGLFVVSNVSYVTFRTIRPEAVALAFAAWSLFWLVHALRRGGSRAALAAGLLGGCAVLCHPNFALLVLAMLAALGVAAVRRRSFRPLAAFAAGAGIAAVALVAHLWRGAGLEAFVLQLRARTPLSYEREGALADALANASALFHGYQLGGRRLYIALVELGLVAWGLSRPLRAPAPFLFAGLAAGFLLAGLLVLRPLSTRGLAGVEWLVFPLLALALERAWSSASRWRRTVAAAAVALFALNNVAGNAYLVLRDAGNTPYGEIESWIAARVPPGSTVLSYLGLWFGLEDCTLYSPATRWRHRPFPDLDALLESGSVDYAVLSDHPGRTRSGASGMAEHPGEP
jgi:hypothetical protein